MEARDNVPLRHVSREPSTYDSDTLSSSQHQQESPPYPATAQEEELPPYERHNNTTERINSTPLHKNLVVLLPVGLYAAGVLWSWERICALSRMDSWIVGDNNDDVHTYKAALTIQTVAAVATIPVISFVCAWAAAVYVQNQHDAYSLSLRQVITLADRSWLNPLVFFRMVFYPSGFKRYGSMMLYIAMFTHLFGAVTYPIQSLFLSTRLVPVLPGVGVYRGQLDTDIQPVNTVPALVRSDTDGSAILTVRRQLETPGMNGYQDNLWGNTSQLSSYRPNSNWFAPLSTNFSTGLAENQYIPRINSSAEIENMDASSFPSNCSEASWFYAAYTYPQSSWKMSIEACLPLAPQTPWNETSDRQDLSEVLYVRVNGSQYAYSGNVPSSFKVQLRTTAASFELPNYYNNQSVGPLLTSMPSSCEYDCTLKNPDRRQSSTSLVAPLAGPLGALSVALFGPGSFADIQQNATIQNSTVPFTGWARFLIGMDDLQNLPLYNFGFNGNNFEGVIPMDNWIETLSAGDNQALVSSAFEQAAFLATQALFDQPFIDPDLMISSTANPTETITLPSISLPAMIACSVLLGLYIVPLLCLALYAAFSHRWTNTLDAFTMLRMGAALGAEDLPLLIGRNKRKIEILDRLPGVVRDISAPDDKIRQLALGVEGGKPLRKQTRYLAYPGNHDKLFPVRDRRWLQGE